MNKLNRIMDTVTAALVVVLCSLCMPIQAQAATPQSCAAILSANPGAADGFYTIDPDGSGPDKPRSVYCDMAAGGVHRTLVPGSSTLLSQAEASDVEGKLNHGPITMTKLFSHVPGDGKTATDFHAAVDGKGGAIAVIEVVSPVAHRIVGYNPLGWNSSNSYLNEGGAFLYNLTTGLFERPTAYPQYAVFDYVNYGPTFGGGHDLYVPYNLTSSGYAHAYSYRDVAGYSIPLTITGAGNYMGGITYGRIEVFAAPDPRVVAGIGVPGYNGDGIQATAAKLYYPRNVAADSNGNVYIADASNHRVRRVDAATGVITTVAGTGVAGYSGDGGQATSAQLSHPISVAVDAAGNLYIADWNNARVRKVDAASGVISTVAGNGSFGYNGDGIQATAAMLNRPMDLALDATGNLYISDYYNARIRRVDAVTGVISTVAGNGSFGYNGDGIQATSAMLYYPNGVDCDAAGNIYIADYSNGRIRRVDAATGVITTVLSGVYSYGISVDAAGNVYHNHWAGNALYRWNAATGTVDTLATDIPMAMGSDVASNGDVYVTSYGSHTVYRLARVAASSNQPPVANAGAAQTVESTGATTAVTLDGSASSDPDGDTLTYTWSWTGGSATGVNPTVNLANGTYTITLTVDDGHSHTATATTTVTVQDTIAPTISIAAIPPAEATSVSGASVDVLSYVTTHDVCTVSLGAAPSGPYGLGSTNVTVTATDCAGNSATATTAVAVVDTTAPAIAAPANVTVEATGPLTAVSIGTATATDIFAVTVTSNAPASYPVGVTTVTWTATDANGNSSTATQTVTVQDTTAPTITAPADVTVEATSIKGEVVAIGTATGTDIFPVTITSDAPVVFHLGTTVVTWTATDANGNTSTATQNVTVQDTTAPAITAPASVTVEATALQTPVTINYNWTGGHLKAKAKKPLPGTVTTPTIDASADDLFPGSFSSDAPAAFPLGDTTVTFTATDTSGNVSTATMVVHVVDTTPPVITAPADVTAEANAVLSTVAIGTATGTDIFGVTITSDAPATFPVGTTAVTWTATDANGNASTATQNVTVADTTPPAITVPAAVTVEATGPQNTVAIGTATGTDIFPVTITSDAPATFTVGTTVVTWTATDANGNATSGTQSVTVTDTTAPALTVPADVTAEATGPQTTVNIGTASAVDLVDGAVTVTNDAPATFGLGTTVVTYTTTDAHGNTATGTQNVTVTDTTPPTVTPPADVTVEANAVNSTVSIGTGSALDLVDGLVAVSSDAPATFPVGTTVVTWSATDAAGNTGTATQNVTVQDTTPPALTVPTDVTAEANAVNSTVSIGTATATDIFPVTITSDAPATYPLGTTVVTWTATDANGNVTTGTQNVTVQDTTPPVLTVPANVTAEANGNPTSTVAIGTATATDIFPVTITSDAPATFPLGTTTVTWTATDANGNAATGTQTVTVQDTTPPVLTVPANVKVEATGLQTSVAIGTATGTDLFGPVSITSNAPATYPLGTTVVTWTATDANGNSSTGTQTVTVVDTTPPTVTAQLVPIPSGHGKSDEHRDSGLFQVVFSASDLVDPNPTLTATLNGATVSNGQIVKLERGRHAEIETEHGRLEIKALSFTLNVTATDASGNVGTGSASYAFPVHQEHEDNGIHRGNDKADHHVDSGKHKSEGKAKIVHKKAGKPAKKASKSKKGKKRG